MIPNVFVSSTVRDLQHLRDSIRDTLRELAYNPILSEYGDVGYLPVMTAEESCYFSIKECQLAVLIIGKRYGETKTNGLSVTHNEFRSARDAKIPVLSLVEQEVLSFKRVFDESKSRGSKASFPGMDNPDMTFGFIQEIADSPFNNGILFFNNTAEARDVLKRQLAHLFSALLQARFDPLKYDVKDILSELKTLRHELIKDDKTESLLFLTATRYVLDDRKRTLRSFVETVCGSIDKAIPQLIKSVSLDDFLGVFSMRLDLVAEDFDPRKVIKPDHFLSWAEFVVPSLSPSGEDQSKIGFYFVTTDGVVGMNAAAKEYFDDTINGLTKALKEVKS